MGVVANDNRLCGTTLQLLQHEAVGTIVASDSAMDMLLDGLTDPKLKHGRAVADLRTRLTGHDIDSFDDLCDHLMVVDRSLANGACCESPIVGTYRLLRQEVAERHGGFYSAGEFEIADLLKRHSDKRFLELGRSCVLPAYRSEGRVTRMRALFRAASPLIIIWTASALPASLTIRILIATEHSSVQALAKFHPRFGANR
jgi:hypothetical protein